MRVCCATLSLALVRDGHRRGDIKGVKKLLNQVCASKMVKLRKSFSQKCASGRMADIASVATKQGKHTQVDG